MFGLSDGEEIMTLAFLVLIQYQSVTDGQTDGHLCSSYTSASIASYANALVKTSDLDGIKAQIDGSQPFCLQPTLFAFRLFRGYHTAVFILALISSPGVDNRLR